jgi:3-deoxy-D-manno-octulosonic-acid transferase
MQAMLDALRPRLLVFSRADVWPELATAAMARGVPVAILAATVGPRSGRLGWPVRPLFRSLYAAISYAGAASNADATRLARLGCSPAVLDLAGDPRHDQVLERVPDGKVLRELWDWAAQGEVLVAGSTEPADEPMVVEAFADVRKRRPAARLLVCPHHPGPQRSDRLRADARRRGLEVAVWRGGSPKDAAPCLIVERAGVLADLYALGALAYVGGGMGPHGVHAMIEPAAYALPVIAGPRGHGADAIALFQAGGAAALPLRHAARALAASWEAWLADGAARARAGVAARRVLTAGAAQRTAARLLELVGVR